MGSTNLLATLDGIDSSVNLTQALAKIRQNERSVTQGFLAKKQLFKALAARLEERGIRVEIRCSGDDCAVVPSKPLAGDDKAFLLREVESTGLGSALRITFIPENVDPSARTLLSVHGEAIETALRKIYRNRRIFVAVDMETTQLDVGNVTLWISRRNATLLSRGELSTLLQAFDLAVRGEKPGYHALGLRFF
jgi:hypothetical protein